MFSGFLPTTREASFMFDFVVIAMTGVLPVLTWSLYIVKYQRNYALHKRLQVGLGGVLLVAVLLFELDIRLDPSWWDRARQSPYFTNGILRPFLWFHLFCAVSTTVLWAVTLPLAMLRFPNPPRPGSHSRLHLRLAKLSAIGMYVTGLTGWTFYWMAFVAE
jgi:hypothetical protein